LVRKTRTDMTYAVCPKCGRSTTVGKLAGGSKEIFYCRECYLEFWVKIKAKSVTCGISYSCGMCVPQGGKNSQKYTWANGQWKAGK
jgi:hypothetical protein